MKKLISGSNERKTGLVVIITALTMVAEIFYGYLTNSLALLADGYHMLTHVFALGLSWMAYIAVRKWSASARISFNKQKLLALSGFVSALVLMAVAVWMGVESVVRLRHPEYVKFGDAVVVAVIGLVVNGISAWVLHHDHQESDHNIRSAYLHVIADALTSITAIVALLAGMLFQIMELDAISGLLSSVVITKWAIGLIKNSGRELIDFERKP